MMKKLQAWIGAARLRTLPLSVSGIIAGSACAYPQYHDQSSFAAIFCWAIVTTLLLQILSNFANDYGDGVKGTDNHTRVGPQRAVQSGVITAVEMKKAVILTALLSLLAALILIYIAFGSERFGTSVFFFLLGGASVAAAIKYTVGHSAYGYRGLGDLFVFVFFGLVSVLGSYYLYAKNFSWMEVLPAVAIGLLSISVLNLNNMRDRESDLASGKNTLVVKLGAKRAKQYHFAIVIIALLALLSYSWLAGLSGSSYFYLIGFVPFFLHLWVVYKNRNPKALDPEMKKVALGTFVLSVFFAISLIF